MHVVARSRALAARARAYARPPRRKPPGKPSASAAQPGPSAATRILGESHVHKDQEWINSDERTSHISKVEKRVAAFAVLSCSAAICMFTWTKWEIDEKLERMSEDAQGKWRDGSYQQHYDQKGARLCIRCSRCKATYPVPEGGLGEGRQVSCTNCGNVWLQTTAELHSLSAETQLVPYTPEMKARLLEADTRP